MSDKVDILELLKAETEAAPQYEDEKIASNLYLLSLSTSYREISSLEGKAKKETKESKQEELISDINKKRDDNEWLAEICPECDKIGVLNFDAIKMKCDPNMTSCDGFLYDFSGNDLSLLIEMKNCSRSLLYKKYINTSSSDSIVNKLQCSKNILSSLIHFCGKLNGTDLTAKTHVVIIYSGKKDMPSENPKLSKTDREQVTRSNGKQSRASSVNFKGNRESLFDKKFAEKIMGFGFSKCKEKDFPVPAEPKTAKKEIQRVFSLFSAQDFAELISKGFFDNWNWGEYTPYIVNSRRCSI